MLEERKLLLEGVLGVALPLLAIAALLFMAYLISQREEGDNIAAKGVITGSILNLGQQDQKLAMRAGKLFYQTDDTDAGGETEAPQDPEPAPEEDQTE